MARLCCSHGMLLTHVANLCRLIERADLRLREPESADTLYVYVAVIGRRLLALRMATGQASVTSLDQVKPSESTVDLESVYADALEQVKRLRDTVNLLERHSEMLLNITLPALTMFSRLWIKSVPRKIAPDASMRWLPRLARLNRFADAIDGTAQSSPQAYGLDMVGLIWGLMKVFLMVP